MPNKIFEKICKQLNLGELQQTPTPLKGGFMHKMFSMFTSNGRFAVKLLNPYVMQRETVFENYAVAESLEKKLEASNIPILPSLTFNGTKMQEIDGQFFYVFEYFNGKPLKNDEITVEHCRKIGQYLAEIHSIEELDAPYNRNEINIDWDFFIAKMEFANDELYQLLKPIRDLLYETQAKGNAAIKNLPAVVTICHNDMDSKNVLWNENACRIIDLECLTYSSPFIELYEMALCWSGYEKCDIDFKLFKELILSYKTSGGQFPESWETVYYSSYGRLEWLEYNAKRALGIDCGEDEKEMGISEVKETIAHIIYYSKVKDDILNCLSTL